MRVISLRRLREFWQRHPDADAWLRSWYRVTSQADWTTLQDVRRDFPSADGVKARSNTTMTVFNVRGNKYRLITNVWYRGRQVYVKMVLTHAEYSQDKWKELL